ncbi:GGDEF domain-containing protein [Deinococcus sp. KSM4-11]|uniref:GGDEF domain-containing protein n=1 Tax=Deinococcus sp. KSM4-11 TaxID=2568654 RepID=UPI00197AF98E|nr:GGDEF domain-containing protein [Deinococcus sp. KSM4-11]
MSRRITPLQELLLRSQQSIVYSGSAAYILYALLTSVIDPPGSFPVAYQIPKYWAALCALATIVAVASAPHRLKQVYLTTTIAYVVVALVEVPRAVASGELPLHLALWLTLNVLVSFVVFGARQGAVLNAASLCALLGVLLAHGPLAATPLADWVTAAIVMGVTGLGAFILMTFIENNLLQHEQDSEKLRAARQDAVTDVYGRGAIEEELQYAMEHAQRINSPMSIIVTDIDHFKLVNDQHGHAFGDDVLRAVGKRLRRNVGGIGGMVGRWGGEEFIVVLPGVAKPDALVLAERLRREIGDTPLAGLPVTASFGVSSYRGTGDTPDQLFGRADMAMYEAKRAGRNAVR